jgi:hypothetical protein
MRMPQIATRTVYGITVTTWLVLCFRFWRRLVARAADDPETYTHGGVFQLLNFVVQYLWVFVVVLAIALAFEWAIFKALAALSGGASARAG